MEDLADQEALKEVLGIVTELTPMQEADIDSRIDDAVEAQYHNHNK